LYSTRDSLMYVRARCVPWCVFFFFFQAEDGIRDATVTGVQTCALPIYPRSGNELLLPQGRPRGRLRLRRADPGSRAHRLAAADGQGPPRRRACPRRGRGTACRPRPGADPRMRVVILYDPGAEDWTPEDIRGVMKAGDEIGTIFGAMGHEIRKVAVRHDMRWFAVARRADVVFNLCEGVHGRGEWEDHVVGTLEFAGLPATGASP